MKYGYEILNEELGLVMDNGEITFDTKEQALEDANDTIQYVILYDNEYKIYEHDDFDIRITPILCTNEERIMDIEEHLTNCLSISPEDRQKCLIWLYEFYTANDITLNELNDLCYSDSDWIFQQIFD